MSTTAIKKTRVPSQVVFMKITPELRERLTTHAATLDVSLNTVVKLALAAEISASQIQPFSSN